MSKLRQIAGSMMARVMLLEILSPLIRIGNEVTFPSSFGKR